MTFLFPIELEFFGSASTFYFYAIILAAGIYFIYKKVPETKGMSLEEIEEFFVNSSQIKIQGTNPVIQRRTRSGDNNTINKHNENFKLSPSI